MLSNIHMTRFLTMLLAGAAQALVLSGCTKDISEVTGFATTPQEAKPFVREARPTSTEYVPVGSTATRAAPRKQVSEFKSLEAELEAKRISNEAAGTQAKQLGATPPPAPAIVP